MSITEDRFRDATGIQYMSNGKVRCQAVSKTKLKQLRVQNQDPTLRPEDVWPAAQCSWAAEPGAFACALHGGKSTNIAKRSVEELWPVDFRERLEIITNNKDVLLNRDREISQLIERNAQLYTSLDDLVLGKEGYATVAEALKLLRTGDVGAAITLLDIALKDQQIEQEVWREVRENVKVLDKLTLTVFNIRKELRLLATTEQVKGLLEGIYRGFDRIANQYIVDDNERGKAVYEFAMLIRELANARHTAELGDGR